MEFITTLFYFLIVIGILVFIHEFGHFAAAKLNGMRADVFAFGMGPRVFGFNKVNGFTFGKLKEDVVLGDNTDYRLCAFPIGGYVKVAGMIDESMDKDFVGKEPQPWEYRSKPVWRRMIVITAGVFMNLVLAFIIFYSITLVKGKNLMDTTTIGYIAQGSPAQEFGLRTGDKIISINGNTAEYWEDIQSKIYIDNLGESLTFGINRNGKDTSILIPKEKIGVLTDKPFGIYPNNTTPIINDVLSGKPASNAGIQANDEIVSYGGTAVSNSQMLISLIKNSAGKETKIEWKRNGQFMSANVTPSVEDSTIGIFIGEKYTGPEKLLSYNVITAIPKTFGDMYYFGVEVFFKSIAKVIKGDIPFKKAIGGPVKIAKASAQSAEAGFLTFINFVALLSMSLAVINILPFPALDGGHFVLLMFEGIFRKPLPYKVQISLQYAGFIILIAFMLFVLYNDLISLN
jgi:regulator of sigma E protease